MSKFNSDAYDKLFPRKEEVEHVETVVPTFTPTDDRLEDDSETTVETSVEEVVDGNDTDSEWMYY